jgi:hypothetical protein
MGSSGKRVNRLLKAHSSPNAQHSAPVRAIDKFPGWEDVSQGQSIISKSLMAQCLPRRWLSLCFVSLGVILFVVLLAHRRLVNETQLSSQAQQNKPTFHTPLLGREEDPKRLWFPPEGSDFQPHIASYNAPLSTNQRCRTPLFVAFTRNSPMLQQTILSYIAAGWPREDIIVVDNSGTLDANNEGLLSQDNPFFLNYKLFRSRYGVSILQTPTLLSFAQLMNFYLRISIAQRWQFFFWSHMDIVVLSDEDSQPYKSFYQRVQDILYDAGMTGLHELDGIGHHVESTWAVKYFAYDWLTLVNVDPWRTIGQWDTFIPYYDSDCDAYSRISMNGFTKDDVRAGRIFDVADVISDPEAKFFPPGRSHEDNDSTNPDSLLHSQRYQDLFAELQRMESEKKENNRNDWQNPEKGGRGEPWTYDPRGFQKMWWDTAGNGRKLYQNKWGTTECRLDENGLGLSDLWKSEYP